MQLSKGIVEDCSYHKAARVQPIGLLHNVPQSAQIVTASDSDLVAVVHVALFNVVRQKEELFYFFLLGNWERNGHHWVECDADTIALRAA